MDEGWIKLYRRIVDNPMYFSEPFTKMQAWIDLLITANYKEDAYFYARGSKVVLKRGQIGISIRNLAKRWMWSPGKVMRFLDDLESKTQIEQQKNNLTTLISICNYDRYQSDRYADRHTDGTQNEAKTDTRTNTQAGTQKASLKHSLSVNNSNKHQSGGTQTDTQMDTRTDTQIAYIQEYKEENTKETTTNVVVEKESSMNADWKKSFAVYQSELASAYTSLLSDGGFIASRQKYYPKVDIRLSMEKAYNDYWNTEAGWMKKKKSRSKCIDWKKTFINALDMPGNRVYLQSKAYIPATESQRKFYDYLKLHAPLMLNMPVQPTDSEIDELRKISNDMLESVVTEINNNRYLTSGRNSVYQTIREIVGKKAESG